MSIDELPATCRDCETPRDPSAHGGRRLCDACCSRELDESACPPACDGLRGGCERCARAWVADRGDDDDLDDDELRAAFLGIYAREPDEEDEALGLWSLVCAGAAVDA